jgi:hypothetical protein
MNSQALLRSVAATHAGLVAASGVALAIAGQPLGGLLLGGALAGLSFVTFWALGRALVEPGRKAVAYVLGSFKILLYLALTAAVLSGRLVADALGFAIGVTCFVCAAIGVALAASPRAAIDARYGSIGT